MSEESASDEWEFEVGDRIQEQHEPHAPGGEPIGKTEYVIDRRLQNIDEDERCYYVELENGGTHLYVAGAIEGRFEVVPDQDELIECPNGHEYQREHLDRVGGNLCCPECFRPVEQEV